MKSDPIIIKITITKPWKINKFKISVRKVLLFYWHALNNDVQYNTKQNKYCKVKKVGFKINKKYDISDINIYE